MNPSESFQMLEELSLFLPDCESESDELSEAIEAMEWDYWDWLEAEEGDEDE